MDFALVDVLSSLCASSAEMKVWKVDGWPSGETVVVARNSLVGWLGMMDALSGGHTHADILTMKDDKGVITENLKGLSLPYLDQSLWRLLAHSLGRWAGQVPLQTHGELSVAFAELMGAGVATGLLGFTRN